MSSIQKRGKGGKAERAVKRHYGLDVLRRVLGAIMPTQSSRAGALMPRYLAPIAGVKYETMRQLLNGGLQFEKDRPLYRMIALNLSLTTGVRPDFRTIQEGEPIFDVFDNEYAPASYSRWKMIGLTADKLRGEGATLTYGEAVPGLIDRINPQTVKLLQAVLETAGNQGGPMECLAYHLMKEAIVSVAKDLGIMEQVDCSDLIDVCVEIDGGPLADQGVEYTTFHPLPWKADAPAISVRGVKLDPSSPKVVSAIQRQMSTQKNDDAP